MSRAGLSLRPFTLTRDALFRFAGVLRITVGRAGARGRAGVALTRVGCADRCILCGALHGHAFMRHAGGRPRAVRARFAVARAQALLAKTHPAILAVLVDGAWPGVWRVQKAHARGQPNSRQRDQCPRPESARQKHSRTCTWLCFKSTASARCCAGLAGSDGVSANERPNDAAPRAIAAQARSFPSLSRS